MNKDFQKQFIMWTGWVVGVIGLSIGLIGNYNSYKVQKKLDSIELIDLYYEATDLLGMEFKGPNTIGINYQVGQSEVHETDFKEVWKLIQKIEVIEDEPELSIGLKIALASKLEDEELIQDFLSELSNDIEEPNRLFFIGMLISKDFNRTSTALDYMQRAVKLSPKNVEMRVIYAMNLHSNMENERSMEELERALYLDKDNVDIINNIGHVLIESRELEDAEKRLNYLIDQNLENDRTYNLLGYLYTVKRDFSVARQYYQQAIDKNFTNPLPHRNLALILAELDELSEAKKEAELAAKYGWPVPDGADYRHVID